MLRNYYINYIGNAGVCDYLIIFGDVLVGSFHTDKNLAITFYGLYGNLPDGKVTVADDFITNTFKDTLSLYVSVQIANVFRCTPIIVIMPLVLALLAWCAMNVIKSGWGRSYATCLKVDGACLTVSAFITAMALFISGYFVSTNLLNVLPLIIVSSILFVRTVILIIYEYCYNKKNSAIPISSKTK